MLKLISLNLERSKHLDRNLPFFEREAPDVLCLQEVLEADLTRIQETAEMPYLLWVKDVLSGDPHNSTHEPGYSGNAILSKVPFLENGSQYYYLPEKGIRLEFEQGQTRRETNAQAVIWASIDKEGERFTLATTHFTWTAEGRVDEFQEADFIALRDILLTLPSHILTGDLNAPRGKGMWEKFQARYANDNIPLSITTTLDPELHKPKGLDFVVDALFSPPDYLVENVRLVSGVSDHQAIVAEIRQA